MPGFNWSAGCSTSFKKNVASFANADAPSVFSHLEGSSGNAMLCQSYQILLRSDGSRIRERHPQRADVEQKARAIVYGKLSEAPSQGIEQSRCVDCLRRKCT